MAVKIVELNVSDEELARVEDMFRSAFGAKVKGIYPYKLLDSAGGISEYVVGIINKKGKKIPRGNLRIDQENMTYRGKTADFFYEIISARLSLDS